MHSHSRRFILCTAALVLFLTMAILLRLQWLELIIPGALMTWYGLVASAPQKRIAPQKPDPGGLH